MRTLVFKSSKGATLRVKANIGRVWLMGDTHFDHANIIRYEDRPFGDVEEMNRALAFNWRRKVRPADLVIFLGDMSYGKARRPAVYWAQRLTGRKVYIKGNHDRGIYQGIGVGNILLVGYRATLEVGGVTFVLVHNPADAPEPWRGWVIHGHIHGKDMGLDRRYINVSAEAINYSPISLASIMARVGVRLVAEHTHRVKHIPRAGHRVRPGVRLKAVKTA